MSPYRSIAPAPRGPRWIRRRMLRNAVTALGLLPVALVAGVFLAGNPYLAVFLSPFLPAGLIALVPGARRIGATALLRAFLPPPKPRIYWRAFVD